MAGWMSATSNREVGIRLMAGWMSAASNREVGIRLMAGWMSSASNREVGIRWSRTGAGRRGSMAPAVWPRLYGL